MGIIIGTSGWSYEDWVGRFYPVDLATKRGDWFSYYSSYFRTVEINSTFYRPPNDFLVNNWIKKASHLKGFEFSVKMPQLITHDALVKGEKERSATMAKSFEDLCVVPLAKAGFMGATLLQLSPYFKYEGDALKNLGATLDALSCDKHDYAIEFRHRTWLEESHKEIVPEARELLRAKNVANVLIDGPGFPVTKEETADHAYVRFHGRNYDIWFADEKEGDARINRYDYLYSDEQLRPWVPRIKEAEKHTEKVRIYMNNHGHAKSVKNAFMMMDLLNIEHAEKNMQIQDQTKLAGFGQAKPPTKPKA
jgi:uncharacterized protein YecE (DUF72 family)